MGILAAKPQIVDEARCVNPRGSDPFGGVESGGVDCRCGGWRCVV